MSTAASVFTKALAYLIGTISLTVWSVLAIRNGYLWQRRSPALKKSIAKAQHDLWSLEDNDAPSRKFRHGFLRLRQDLQLHYLASANIDTKRANLVIFLHGFPDSCHVFAHFLSSELAKHANLVSLDIPGFGGSDGLSQYGADEVLNAIVSGIAMLKARYLDRETSVHARQCILVGHDWGGAISSRLAMETTGLIDRVVIMNGPIPKLFARNLYSKVSTARDHLGAWWQNPRETNALYEAKDVLRPVLAQLVKSNYVFMFNLPFVTMGRFRFLVEYLISACHEAAAGPKNASAWKNWSWAASIGPGIHECAASDNQLTYGNDVAECAMKFRDGDWDTRIRLYKEGLFSESWTLQHEDAAVGVEQVKGLAKATFQCPAFLLWGKDDVALDHRICVAGVESLFSTEAESKTFGSEVRLLDNCGHWSPLDETSTATLLEYLLQAVRAQASRD